VGGDDFSIRRAAFDLNYNMKWNNQMASIQWMHYYNSHHISRTSAYYTRSYLSLFIGQNNFNYRLISNNEDYSIKHEHRLIFERLRLKGGIQALQQLVIPNKSEAVLNELEADFGTPNDFHTRTLSAYFESEVAINHKFSVLAGLRGNAYTHVGPYYQFIRDEVTRQIKDTIYYGWGQKVRSYYEQLIGY
jgi:hypothetical protein